MVSTASQYSCRLEGNVVSIHYYKYYRKCSMKSEWERALQTKGTKIVEYPNFVELIFVYKSIKLEYPKNYFENTGLMKYAKN
jgi:hypothetical protein